MRTIIVSFLICVTSCFATQAQSKLLPATEQQNTKAQPAFSLDSLITACLADISADSIEHYMRELEGFGNRFMLNPNRRMIAGFLADKFISFGCTEVAIDSFLWENSYTPGNPVWQYNVVATLNGTVNAGVEYLVGGHYDNIIVGIQPFDSTWFIPGADDNASGIAATLEIARVLAAKNIQPGSTLKFVCFASEEEGHGGSRYFADSARQGNRDIGYYLNLDMIANSDGADSLMLLQRYDNGHYVCEVARQMCLHYTYLTPEIQDLNYFGSDSYSFWVNNYEAVFVFESQFSPHCHLASDTVGNCNMAYCAENTKTALAALLNGAYMPRPVHRFSMLNADNCSDAKLLWTPTRDENFVEYKIYFGPDPAAYDTIIFTTDTALYFDNLVPGTKYYAAVSVLNSYGFESMLKTDSMTSMICDFNEGVLIVDGSDGGLGDPSDVQVDAFYNDVFFGFQRTEYAADSIGLIDLATLGKYSSIFWHINSEIDAESFVHSERALENYLSCGGNLFLSCYRPGKTIGLYDQFGLNDVEPESFVFDFLKMKSFESNVYSRFNSAVPDNLLFDSLHCDSSKTAGFLKYVEVLNPTSEAAKLYWYDSPYDTTQSLGELKYKNVGVLYDGSDFKTLTLGFPLYYMKKDEVQSMLRYVFENIFGEVYTGIEENATVSNLQCYPNPVKDVLYVKGAAIDHYTITDVSGRVVLSGIAADNSIQVNKLKPGVYILRTGAAVLLFVKE